VSSDWDRVCAEVAADHGLPAGAESFLTGSTLDEIEAEADALVKVLGASERQPEPTLDPISEALRQKQRKRQQLLAAITGRREQPRDRQGRYVSFDGGARQPVPGPPPTHDEYLTDAIRSHRHDVGPKFNNG
jgi:hypothetical protein